MISKTLLTALAAAGLFAAAAQAQQAAKPPADKPVETPFYDKPAPYYEPAPTAAPIDAAAKAPVILVTNGPVPDNAANRDLYPPLSNAGQRTAAAGN